MAGGLQKSPRADKRFVVRHGGRAVHFGAPGASTYADGAGEAKRRAYLARHGAAAAGENWADPATPGFWSRWALWERPSLEEGYQTAVAKAAAGPGTQARRGRGARG